MEEINLLEIFGNYMAWKLTERTWVIQFMNGSEYIYLLEGNEKALLLDTGYAAGNLRAFAEKLTDKPIIVANTHFHPDHAAGNGEFEEVMMSAGYVLDEPSVTEPGTGPFDINNLPHPDYKKIILHDGDKIDLGGRVIEVWEARPAHCNSSLFFFDPGYGLFFCGDDLESAQVMMFDNSHNPVSVANYDVKDRLDSMKANTMRMKALGNQIKYLLPNHNGTPISLEYIDDFIGLIDHIYAGDAVIEDKLNHKYVEMEDYAAELCRVRWKGASIFIKKAEVMKVYGSER